MDDEAERQLLHAALEALRHYRTRPHMPSEHDGYLDIGPVADKAAQDADRVLRIAREHHLIAREEMYQ